MVFLKLDFEVISNLEREALAGLCQMSARVALKLSWHKFIQEDYFELPITSYYPYNISIKVLMVFLKLNLE